VLHASAWTRTTPAISAGGIRARAGDDANTLPALLDLGYLATGDQDAVRPRAEATLVYGTQSYPADAGILAFDDDPGDASRGQIVYLAFYYNKLTGCRDGRPAARQLRALPRPRRSGLVGGGGGLPTSVFTLLPIRREARCASRSAAGGSQADRLEISMPPEGWSGSLLRIAGAPPGWMWTGGDSTSTDGVGRAGCVLRAP